MTYKIAALSPQLIFIQLTGDPTEQDDTYYTDTVKKMLDESPMPIYFLIDFRKAMTTRITTIRKLVALTKHPMFVTSLAFTSDVIRSLYMDLFAQLSQTGQDETYFQNAKAALAKLEELCPGVTSGIDWEAVLAA